MNLIFKLMMFLFTLFVCFSAIAQEEKKSLGDTLTQLETEKKVEVDSLIEKVKSLEKNGDYKNSRIILAKELGSKFSHQIVSYWIQSDQKILDSISVKNKSISIFEPNKRSATEYWAIFKEVADSSVCKDPAPVRVGKSSSEYLKEKRLKNDENKNFDLLTHNKISETLEIFDVLKFSVSTLQTILDLTIQQNFKQIDQDELSKLNGYKKQTKEMKVEIKDKHTQFLSYDVVSPYLAAVNQWLYLAKAKGTWFQLNEKAFDIAIKNLSLACHHQKLMECSEEVRLQFFEVQKTLKSMVGKEEFEELKVLTTLQDSNDPSKKRGADAWWE